MPFLRASWSAPITYGVVPDADFTRPGLTHGHVNQVKFFGATGLAGDLGRLEKALSDHLATRVRIKTGARKGGQLVIDFSDWSHLDALLERQGLGKVLADQDQGA